MTTNGTELNSLSLSDHLLEMICNICNRFLNVCPISYSENIGNICGRCSGDTFNDLGPVVRQHTYEKLISKLSFPCTNKNYGCNEFLKFAEVPSHERSCKFQCTNCPLFYKQLFPDKHCQWTGNNQMLCDHLKSHKNLFLAPPQFDWPQDCRSMVFFTYIGDQVVTVVIKHEQGSKYACVVMINGTDLESQCLRYQLELSDEDKKNSLVLRRNRLEPLSDFPDNLRFPDKALEVDIKQISQILQYPEKVTACIRIVKKQKKEINQITGIKDGDVLIGGTALNLNKQKNATPDEEMLAELECPVCNEFMTPPIFICSTGHSVCGNCKDKVRECPTCRIKLGNGRNFTLEKLTEKVKYPCKNREIGCGFVTTSQKIKQHQHVCELSENPCILKCGWIGLTPAVYNHFLDQHKEQLIECNTSILMDLNYQTTRHYFLYIMGNMFCLSFQNCWETQVMFTIQHVGHFEFKPEYKYSIQFASSPNAESPNFCITNMCQNWNPNLSEALGPEAVFVPKEILKAYVFRNLYYIKINIMKIEM